jgi:hypothetical protein
VVAPEADLVLGEGAEEALIPVLRHPGHLAAVLDVGGEEPVSEAPDEPVPLRQRELVLEVDVPGVQTLLEGAGDVPVRAVPIDLELQARLLGEAARPPSQEVAALHLHVVAREPAGRALVEVALDGIGVPGRGVAIHPEADLPQTEGIFGALAVRELQGAAGERVRVGSVERPLPEPAAVADPSKGTFHPLAASGLHDSSLGRPGALGDDVDDAVDRVGPPQGGPGTADDLDPLHVLEEGVLHVPEDAREQRRVDAASIDQDQQLVGGGDVEPAGRDGPGAAVGLGHLNAVGEPQGLGERRRPGAPEILPGEHRDRGRGAGEALAAPGDGGHVDLHQLLDREPLEVLRRHRLLLGRGGQRQTRRQEQRGDASAGLVSRKIHGAPGV